MRRLVLVAVIVTLTACSRPGDYPISSNCTWIEDDNHALNLANMAERHLYFDAITAEDMAIRWAASLFSHWWHCYVFGVV
ncbi:MAG TPA: hypothetical protein VLB46_16910 [Pyrinomonadaceae bacterium]|nr:hypothetical protein [Pyrinomonadaceae bacterium]